MPNINTESRPLPTGPLPTAVVESSERLLDARSLEMNASVVEAWTKELLVRTPGEGLKALGWPLKFSTVAQEAGVLGHLAMVEAIAERYATVLATVDRTPHDIAQYAAMSLYISQPDATPQAYLHASDGDVASMLNLPLQVERPHETLPAVMIGEASEVAPLIHTIAVAFRSMGERLSSERWSGLGEALCWVATQSRGDMTACVDKLVRAFPGALDDTIILHSIPLSGFVGAQRMVRLAGRTLGGREASFAFKEDTLAPTPSYMLIQRVAERGLFSGTWEEEEKRAGAVVLLQRLREHLREKVPDVPWTFPALEEALFTIME